MVKLIQAQNEEQGLKCIIAYIEYSTTANPEHQLHPKHKRLESISYRCPPVGSGCHGHAVAKHSSFPMVSHWFPRLGSLRRNAHDKLLTSLTGLAMFSCLSVQGPHANDTFLQEVTVYFDCAHSMAIQIFVAARCT